MSLTLALNNALSGLNVNQKSLSVLSQNIANANTAGYSRQIVDQQPVYIDGNGSGVSIEDVTRRVDAYLQKAVATQISVAGQTSVSNDYSARLQLLLGNPGSGNSIPDYIGSFFNSVQSLAQTPEDATAHQNLVNAGVSLGSQMQQLVTGLQGLQFQADQDVAGAISNVNAALDNLYQLNSTISNAALLGQSTAGLEDKRDMLVSDLSQYLPVQVTLREYGAVSIATGNGTSLLDDNRYQLSYNQLGAQASFANGTPLSPIIVQRLDATGKPVAQSTVQLASGGLPENVVSTLSTGKLQGLLDMRDKEIPSMMAQLDTLSAGIRDQVNAAHNSGSSYPGVTSLTGTRALNAQDFSVWEGKVRIAVLTATGAPIPSPYPDEPNGVKPLTLDLGQLDSGGGTGNPSVQGIIDAINEYYAPPQPKMQLGNLNNIQLVSDSRNLPGAPAQFSFDFNLDNLSSQSAGFFVTGVTVTDSTNTDITSLTSNVPSLALAAANTYTTTAGSGVVTVQAAAAHGLQDGDMVYLSTPPGAVDGIAASALGGYFRISGVTTSSFQITTIGTAGAGGTFGVAAQSATPPYATAEAGADTRTKSGGLITASLAGNVASPFYNITVNIGVDDGSGTVKTAQVTYRVDNNVTNVLNDRYAVRSAIGGLIVQPQPSTQPLARAMLVNASGVELPVIGGQYTNQQNGYLKIVSGSGSSLVAIDSLNSIEQGQPNNNPPRPATGRGFSHFFNLNDLYDDTAGGTIKGAAASLKLSQRIVSNTGLVSTGNLTRGNNLSGSVNYTYGMSSGDNSVIQKMAALASAAITFQASGGLGLTQQTFGNYSGNIIGAVSTNATSAKTLDANAQTLLQGYQQRSSSVSGVNLDTELANTIIYQNAYSASARVITVTSDFFNALLQSFG